MESGPLFVGLVALKSSDSIVAADDEEGEDVDPVGDDELAIFSLFSVSFLITPQDSFKTSMYRVYL